MARRRVSARSYLNEISLFLSPIVFELLRTIYFLAKHGHRKQVRKEVDRDGKPVPYIQHPLSVAVFILRKLKITLPELHIAAILHDIIEDTKVIKLILIEHLFGPDVAVMISLLTKKPKRGYIKRLMMCRDWRVLLIKACDRYDNLLSMGKGVDPAFIAKQIKETETKYYPLLDRLCTIAPPEYAIETALVRDLIKRRVQRLKKRLNNPASASAISQ